MSVDPDVAETGQPYAFVGDDPLNATDPLGLSGSSGFDPSYLKAVAKNKAYCSKHPDARGHSCGGFFHELVGTLDKQRHFVAEHRTGELQIVGTVLAVASIATGVGALAGTAELGFVSGALGAASGATDLPACIGGNGLSCIGAASGITGGLGGVAGAGINAALKAGFLAPSVGAEFAAGLSGSLGFASGAGAAFFDPANDLGSN